MMRVHLVAVAAAVAASGAVGGAEMSSVERQRLLAHLEMTRSWLPDEVAGLSPKQLAFRPSPGAWSIAEVLDHLLVVAPIYWEDLQQALKRPPSDVPSQNSDADILWYGIDRTRREQAIPGEVPKGRFRELAPALDEWRAHHERLRRYVSTTKDDLRRHVVPRQGSDAYQWVLLISTHEQRHILQIREIKSSPGFPR